MLSKPSVILIVDDLESNRSILKDWVSILGHQHMEAENGKIALKLIEEQHPDLILLDIMMPEMNGFEMLQHLKKAPDLKHIPILLISASNESDNIVRGIEEGADDYLVKPFKPAILKARIKSCLEKKHLYDMEKVYLEQIKNNNLNLQKIVEEQIEEIMEGQNAMTFAMCKMAESRDSETGDHLDRMREYCKILAIELRKLPKYSEVIDDGFIDTLYKSSPLHDIGKIGIPDNILKKPGKLSQSEFEIMKEHAGMGLISIQAVYQKYPKNKILHMGAEIAGQHHEKWDGSGYPNALAGTEISLAARILALCDVYDALTSKRPYKEPFTHEVSKKIILEGEGKHFDPDIVKAFLEIENTFNTIHKKFSD